MKKIFFSIVLAFFVCVSHAEIGVGVKYGYAPSDNNLAQMEYTQDAYNQSITEKNGFYGIEFLFEKTALKDALGLKIGFSKYGTIRSNSSFTDPYSSYMQANLQLKNDIYALPVSLYYKYKFTPQFNIYGGAGATLAYSRWKATYSYNYSDYWQEYYYESSEEKESVIVFPHLDFGAEWRINKTFALGVDFSYNFNSETDTSGLKRDIDGLQTNAVLRMYF